MSKRTIFANQHTQVFNIVKSAADRLDCTFSRSCTIRKPMVVIISFGRRSSILYTVKKKPVPKYVVEKCQNLTSLHGVVCQKHVCISMLKHKRVAASSVERLTSEAFSAPMLVVSFYLCHCSLLCFSDFLVILSAIYQRKEKTRKPTKKKKLFLCIMAYVNVFEGRCSVRFLILCRKK